MCGISGIINKNTSTVDLVEIKSINDLICHRGPDAEGYYFGKNFALGHRRLSIIDLSEGAHQPMIYQDKYVIVYNGEIYNYLEIRKELLRKGYRFKTNSDTEVILGSYDLWGVNCINRFNGMWSFALFDKEKNILFFSRDRFGVKPFYYIEVGDKFIFGSEIKQMLPFLNRKIVNKQTVSDYLILGLEDHTNDTFFEGIKKLEQSHSIIYNLDNHNYQIQRYYYITVDKEIEKYTENRAIEYFRELFYDSVNLRLRSDVKVGTCLSGGLDSSSISSIASVIYEKKTSKQFSAITAKSSEIATDETFYASLVARENNLDWHIVEPTTSQFVQEIDRLILIQEEPFGGPSVYMQYKVFEMAKKIGCIVMLDGQGGDETLLGYERYYPSYIFSLPVRSMVQGFINSSRNSGLTKLQVLKYLFYFTNAKIRISVLKHKLNFVLPKVFDLINRELVLKSSSSYYNIIEMQKLEIMKTQLPHLLKYEDRNSMFHSIESRLPFLDYRMLECSLSINNNLKIREGWTKYIQRKAQENVLPKNIVWRKNKLGFNAPEKTWIDGLEKKMLESIVNSKILNNMVFMSFLIKNYSHYDLRTKWKLYNIAQWEQLYNVDYE